jgi:hypothetical protein
MTSPPPPPYRSASLGLAGILIAIFLGLALFELRAVRPERAKLTELTAQHAADEKRLQQLEQTAKTAAAQTGPEKTPASSAPANGASPNPRAAARAARKAGQAYAKAFFAAYPQARAMLIEYQTRNMENYYAPFFREAGMSQAQIDEFIARTAETHLNSLVLNAGGNWTNGQPNLSADDIRSLLGDTAYQQWQDAARAIPAENWVGGLASSVKNGAAPLTSDQAFQLTQIVVSTNPDYAAGKTVNLQSVDLESVIEQAKPLMTDAQWQQAQNYLTIQRANQQLRALMKGGQ